MEAWSGWESQWSRLGLDADPHRCWDRPESLPMAERYCRAYTRRHTENFHVVSWLLPRAMRRPFYPIYAYCRAADDIADRVDSPAVALQLLDHWQGQLDACYDGVVTHPIFAALRAAIREYELPRAPFVNLLSAFRRDQHPHDYRDHDEVLAYCRCSADPVGRLILYLGRCADSENIRLSDSVCTGLQLINFCQDVARDADRGRIYVPRVTREQFGYADTDWQRRVTDDAFRQVMQLEVDRAEGYLLAGRELVRRVPRRLSGQVELFVAGGLAVVQAIRRIGYGVWSQRPVIGRFAKLAILGKTLARQYGLTPWTLNSQPVTRSAAR